MTRHPIGKGGARGPRLVAVGYRGPGTAGFLDLGHDWPACRVCSTITAKIGADGLCEGCRDVASHAEEERRIAQARFEEGEESYPNVPPTRLADVLPFVSDRRVL